MLNLKQYDNDELDDLEGHILEIYKELSSSNYLRDVQISELVKQTITKIRNQLNEQPLFVIDKALMLMNGLLSLGIKFTTYSSFKRRFDLFLTMLGEQLIQLLDEHDGKMTIEEKHAITEALIHLFRRYVDIEEGIWSPILAKWLIQNEQYSWVKSYYRYFQQLSQEHHHTFQIAIITSLLALICEDGVGSIYYLKKFQQRLMPNDLYFHFTLLNRRREWDTMQSWFELFSTKWNGTLGNLQPFYNLLVKQRKHSFDFTNRFTQWLNRPTLQSYLDLSNSLEDEERKLLFEKVKKSFNDQLSYPTIQCLFIQIILHEERWSDGVYFFLNNEHNPFQLSNEKQQLLENLEKHIPNRTIAIYHQFVVRLVEKKMRSHYCEAVQYMKKLKHLYEKTNQAERFKEYITTFSQTYKTYRALIQEMKSINE